VIGPRLFAIAEVIAVVKDKWLQISCRYLYRRYNREALSYRRVQV
jgi:hypothetical protein